MKYYITLEDDGMYIYYSEFKNKKLAEEYRNILVLYFTKRNFRIKVRSSISNKTSSFYLKLDNSFENDVVCLIRSHYNNKLTREKFQEYFHE